MSNVRDSGDHVNNFTPREKLSGDDIFHQIRKVLLRNLAADHQVKNITMVAQLEYLNYDAQEKMLTIQMPPGKMTPSNSLVKWMKEICECNNFPVDTFKFVSSNQLEELSDKDAELIVHRADRVEMKKTHWLWPGYIPLGCITILAGDPGVGKSQASIDLVARITRGDNMPDGTLGIKGNCGIATAEDEASQTVIPRLAAAGADMKRVSLRRKVKVGGDERYIKLPQDLSILRKMIIEQKLKLLIIDPLNAFIHLKVDTYKDQDVRNVLGPVEDMAEGTGCSVMFIAHLTKKEEAAVLYRVGGSIGLVGAARAVLAAEIKKNDNQMRILYSLKENLCKKGPAQQFGVEDCEVTERKTGESIRTSKVEWHGTCPNPTLAGRDEGPQQRKECLDFLIYLFSTESELPAIEVKRSAAECGLAWRTLMMYKPEFKVQSIKQRDGHWAWREPDGGFAQFRMKK
jgi:hypothetical protein